MYRWDVKHKYCDGDNIVDILLQQKGFKSESEKEEFLNPPKLEEYFRTFPNEFKEDVKKARDLIQKAIDAGSCIIIHGDYDADGVVATAVLYKTLYKELGYNKVYPFIPNRFEHGYGLSEESINAALENIPDKDRIDLPVLFITVDSGITSVDEVAYIKELGHDVIVTDHHQKPASLPKADCLVWNDQMVGAGVAWVISKSLGSKDISNLGLVALATVTDLQPVIGFNRSIVKNGLWVLNNQPPVGIEKLLKVSGRQGSEVTSYDLGWVIGPRINASGRMEEASNSLSLLVDDDSPTAEKNAAKLNSINIDRQNKMIEMYEIAAGFDEEKLPKVIFSSNENYHEGLIGLVAARIVQKHFRPAIVVSLFDDHGKGSVRSIPGVNIIEILRKFDDLFDSLGGHPMAAGFSISKDKIELLKEKLLDYFEKNIDDSMYERVLNVNVEIPAETINLELLDSLERFKPFGIDNAEPVFSSTHMGVVTVNTVGHERSHLSLKLLNKGNFFKAIFFNGADRFKDLEVGEKIDVVYSLKKNEFNGKTYIDLVLKDIQKTQE